MSKEKSQLLTDKAPLTTTVLIRLIIALAWKVQPFRVPEFVADKVQIGLTPQRMCDESTKIEHD